MNFKKLHSGSDVNIFTEIAKLSAQFNAVNLSQGSPDYEMDIRLKKFMKEGLEKDMNRYASAPVIPELIENLIEFNHNKKIPFCVSEKEITVCPGTTYSIYVALATFLEAGDEVIVFEPCYETYCPAIEIRKAKTVYVSLDEHFNVDFNLLKDKISPKTKAIIVNSPHNPSGKIWKKEDWNSLWEIIKNTDIIIISDEVYDQVVYDNLDCLSAFHHPEIKNRCFCIFSFEKMFHISGWKASYIVACEQFTNAFNDVHQYLTFTINIFAQYALTKYLKVFDAEENRLFFQKKRDLFYDMIKDLPFDIPLKAEAGYFQTVNFRNFDKNFSDKDFATNLIQKLGVASIPYSAFYHDRKNTGNIRFCFAKKDETLVLAAESLRKMIF